MISTERAKEEPSVSTTEQKPEKQPTMDFPKRPKKVSLVVGDVIRRNNSDILARLATR